METFIRYIIPNQKDIYKYKLNLFSFGLKYNYKKQYYYNPFEIDLINEEQLKNLLETNQYVYTIKEENELDFTQKIEFIYKLFVVDEYTFFVTKRRTNENIFFISVRNNLINIMDLITGKSLSKKFTIKDNYSLINQLLVLSFLNSVDNDFYLLNQILSVLVESDNQELNFQNKMNAFKYHVFTIIKEKMQDDFICNCVDGFFPETNFYLKGNRIYSDYLENFVSFEQEIKILKYLFNNRKYIGVKKELTYKDKFLGKRIFIKNADGFENKVVISKIVKNRETNKLVVDVFDGVKKNTLTKEINEEELFKLVKYTRGF